MMRLKKYNTDIATTMNKIATKYNCNLPIGSIEGHCPGVVSCQISQYIIDGHDDDDNNNEYVHHFILNRDDESYGFTLEKMLLEKDEVYAIDIVMCSGSGKLNAVTGPLDGNIYKRSFKNKVNLKLKSARNTLNSFDKNPFPININPLTTNNGFRFGLKECTDKGTIESYLPYSEKVGEYIARSKFTVIVRKKPILITGRSMDDQVAKTG